MTHADFITSQVSRLTVHYDIDDQRPEYDVKFYVGSTKYEYDIDAATGRLLSFEAERGKSGGAPSPTNQNTRAVNHQHRS